MNSTNKTIINRLLKSVPCSILIRFIKLATLAGIKIITDQLLKSHAQDTVQDIKSHFNAGSGTK